MASDRLQLLLNNPTHVGIDFIRVDPSSQTTLWVFFIDSDADKTLALETASAFAAGGPGSIRIESISPDSDRPVVDVDDAAWEPAATFGRRALRVTTASPGDFSIYTLTLLDPPPATLDPYYASIRFTFKAGCESRLDCKPSSEACLANDTVDVPIDYTARDWRSYRRALLEMVSLRHPHYKDRLEADLGIMFAESLAAVADELTYTQDRFAREAHLETATQRRSVRRLARFVDYEMHDGLAASTWLSVEVSADTLVTAGTSAVSQDGTGFEVGENIERIVARRANNERFSLIAALNVNEPYLWDEDDTCLKAGSREMTLIGDLTGPLTVRPRRLLLRETPENPSLPIRSAWIVVEEDDVVAVDTDPLTGDIFTRITWGADWALAEDLDLERLVVHGNLLPVVAGETRPPWSEGPATFAIRTESDEWSASVPHAVEREGRWTQGQRPSFCADEETASIALPRPVTFMHPLADSDAPALRLAWTPVKSDAIGAIADEATLGRNQRPEVWLREVDADEPWVWKRTMLGVDSSFGSDDHYTLDDGLWQEVARYWVGAPEPVRHFDYRTGRGATIRFGDGEFGRIPARGTSFELRYRLCRGEQDNLPQGRTFTLTDPDTGIAVPNIVAATNPRAIVSGLAPEAMQTAKTLAPEAWRAVAYRAVIPEDYAEALERLDDVDRAGAAIHWTGSWPAVFATPDPAGRTTLTNTLRDAAQDQIDRFRQTGRPAYVLDPVYAWLDLHLTICVDPGRYRSEVQSAIRTALVGHKCRPGFFHPDKWTFGDPLHRSALEAAIHAVAGVESVRIIEVRRRGFFDWTPLASQGLEVEDNAVIGLSDDPRHPERGSLTFEMEGGA